MTRPARLAGLLMAVATIAMATAAIAEPPEGGPPGRGPDGPPHDPLRAALDADGDHALSAEEIKNASAAMAKLDRDGDGRIDREEFRPPRPPRRGPPDGEAAEGRRPPRESGGPRGERPEGRPPRGPRPEGGATRGPSPERFADRAMAFDADGDGKLDRAEMQKFAAELQQRVRGGQGGPREGGERPE